MLNPRDYLQKIGRALRGHRPPAGPIPTLTEEVPDPRARPASDAQATPEPGQPKPRPPLHGGKQ